MATRLEQRAGTVEIHPVAQVRILFALAAHDRRQVEDGDVVLIDKHGHHYMFDFKRTAHALDSHAPGVAGRTGRGPLAHVPDTPFMRYSLQQVSRGSVACLRPLPLAPAPRERDSPSCNASLAPLALAQSLYALMLQQTHGVAVDDRSYLLAMHTDRNAHEVVQCRDLRPEARQLLELEGARLRAEPAEQAPTAGGTKRKRPDEDGHSTSADRTEPQLEGGGPAATAGVAVPPQGAPSTAPVGARPVAVLAIESFQNAGFSELSRCQCSTL